MSRAVKIAVLGDSRSLQKALRDSESRMGRLNDSAGKLGQAMKAGLAVAGTAAAVGTAAIIKSSVDVASNLEQASGAVETIWGKGAASVEKFAAKQQKTLKSTKQDVLNMATTLGQAGIKNQGQLEKIMSSGSDLVAAFGGNMTEFSEATSGAMRGEFDSLQKWVPTINQAAVEQEMANSKVSQSQAILNLVNKEGVKVQGQAAREGKSFAGMQQKFGIIMEQIQEKIGKKVIPVLVRLGDWFINKGLPAIEKVWPVIRDKLGSAFEKVQTAVEKVSPILETLGTWMKNNPEVIRNVAITVGILATAFGIYAGVMAIVNAVMLASPLTWIVLAIVAVVVAVTLLVKHWDKVTKVMGKAWDKVKQFGGFLRDEFLKLIGKVGDFGKKMGEKVWEGIKKIGTKLKTIGSWIWNNFYPGPLLKLGGWLLDKAKAIGGKIWTGIKNVGSNLRTIGSWAWDKFKGGLDNLKTKFTNKGGDLLSGLVNGLKNKWDSVKNATKKPLNLIIDVAINPFITTINKLPGVDISKVKRFATGGAVFGAGTSTSDSIPALLSNDEHVLTAREVKGMGGHRAVEAMRGWARRFATGGRVWPVGNYGIGTRGYYSDGRAHKGVDFPRSYGTPVHAATSGTAYASSAGWNGVGVNVNGEGTTQWYAHLSRRGKLGRVNAGDVIGYVGSTGNSTGNHLHFNTDDFTYKSAIGFLQGASNPKGGGFLSKLLGKFSDIKSFVSDKVSGALKKVSGGGLLTTDNLQALLKNMLNKVMGTIPGLATGGIVRASNGGTIIRAGEGGYDEMVVPMKRRTGGSKTEIHNHYEVKVSPFTDPVAVAKELKKIADAGRTAGIRIA